MEKLQKHGGEAVHEDTRASHRFFPAKSTAVKGPATEL
jgi:hypothetical protein